MYYKPGSLRQRSSKTKFAYNINIKFKLFKSQNYLYEQKHMQSEAKDQWKKKRKEKDQIKPQKIGDSSNNNRAGTWKCSVKKRVLRIFRKNHRKIPVLESLS